MKITIYIAIFFLYLLCCNEPCKTIASYSNETHFISASTVEIVRYEKMAGSIYNVIAPILFLIIISVEYRKLPLKLYYFYNSHFIKHRVQNPRSGIVRTSEYAIRY